MKPPTKEFCDELRERARRLGWMFDFTEIRMFIVELYREAEVEISLEDFGEPYGEDFTI